MGGPSAAIVLQELIALGARRAIRVGTCGALAPGLELGSWWSPREAIAADGTSRALGAGERAPADGADRGGACGRRAAGAASETVDQRGPVLRRPTCKPPAGSARAVEMEAAALFALGSAGGDRGGVRADRLGHLRRCRRAVSGSTTTCCRRAPERWAAQPCARSPPRPRRLAPTSLFACPAGGFAGGDGGSRPGGGLSGLAAPFGAAAFRLAARFGSASGFAAFGGRRFRLRGAWRLRGGGGWAARASWTRSSSTSSLPSSPSSCSSTRSRRRSSSAGGRRSARREVSSRSTPSSIGLEALGQRADATGQPFDVGRGGEVERAESDLLGLGGLLAGVEGPADRAREEGASSRSDSALPRRSSALPPRRSRRLLAGLACFVAHRGVVHEGTCSPAASRSAAGGGRWAEGYGAPVAPRAVRVRPVRVPLGARACRPGAI